MRPRQNGRHFADDTFKHIFLNENIRISIKISLKFVPKGPIDNIPKLVQIMAWRRPSDKPFSEPMMVRLPTHICVTRPQWVNCVWEVSGGWQPVGFFVNMGSFPHRKQHSNLLVLRPRYLGRTRSILWLQMPWPLTSPTHSIYYQG